MPSLDWTVRPRRMFYVRRRALQNGVFLVHLAQIYKLNPASDCLWQLCDGNNNLRHIVDEMVVAASDQPYETTMEWVCSTLLFMQRAVLIAPLYAECHRALPAERYDWPFAEELCVLVRAVCPEFDNGMVIENNVFQAFVDRIFRLCFESYFARNGQWFGLGEEAFRNYWIEAAQIDLTRTVAEWKDTYGIKSLFFDFERGFCRMAYTNTVYEGFIGHRR